eukprot:scaffold34858_cov57-Phaeocystis_antarctica.AAC.1
MAKDSAAAGWARAAEGSAAKAMATAAVAKGSAAAGWARAAGLRGLAAATSAEERCTAQSASESPPPHSLPRHPVRLLR